MVAASSAPWSRRDIVPPSLELASPGEQYGDDDRPQPVDAGPAQRSSLRSTPHAAQQESKDTSRPKDCAASFITSDMVRYGGPMCRQDRRP
jgi:hypothetical protein